MAELALQTILRFKTTTCITCGVIIAMNEDFYDRRLHDHRNYFCPSGHQQHFTSESKAEKNARLLREEQERHKRTLARENAERAAKEKAERKLKRVGKGVCPECKRSFQNLARHMHCKHGIGPDAKLGKPKLP